MGGGEYINPIQRIFLNLSGGTVTGNTLFTQNLSATTFYSGSTDLSDIIGNISTSVVTGATRIQNGLNTYTGGTQFFPTVNVSGLSIDNIFVSGSSLFNSLSASTLSGGTIFSGSTELESIITSLIRASDTFVQDGINTFTGGTKFRPTVNITGLSVNNITVSGSSLFTSLSATTISGGTIYSGSTDLSLIFQTIGSDSAHTHIQNGLNTYTGGTTANPNVNVSALTIDRLTVSGASVFNTLTATTVSGGTIYSGSTDLSTIFGQVYVRLNTKANISGATFTGAVIAPALSATTLSGGTIYSGSTPLENIFVTSGQSIGLGEISVFEQKVGSELRFRTFSAGTNVSLGSGDTITISVPEATTSFLRIFMHMGA
jgi:hypothetical protein